MNFFDHQVQARRRTALLAAYFLAAVVAIVLTVHLAVAGVLSAANSQPGAGYRRWLLDPQVLLATLIPAVALIALGSLVKIAMLGRGGRAVAEMLGGRLIPSDTADPDERRVINVVEEMAIASGIQPPPVYVMDEESSINAFAAGFRPGDAVIGVSRGAIELLSREELQGVVAHEYSHILNGDMRLNVRLIGLLHGILLLGLIGQTVLRGLSRGRWRVSSGRGRNQGGAAGVIVVIIAISVALTAIGYIGVLFGRLIKAAISRQREFLADASAVQFTRDPSGISGALKKIGGLLEHARLKTPNAEQASHLFFGDAIGLSSLFATHPPLDERIRRIDKSWDGSWPAVTRQEAAPAPAPATPPSPLPAAAAGVVQVLTLKPETLVQQIGKPTPAHLAHAQRVTSAVPPLLQDAAHSPFAARALVFALLLDPDPAVRERQTQAVRAAGDAALIDRTLMLQQPVSTLPREHRLALVAMAMPALQQMSRPQFESFRSTLQRLIEADRQMSLFEFAVAHVFIRRLSARFEGAETLRTKWYSLNGPRESIGVLLSALAHEGAEDAEEAIAAFALASHHLQMGAPVTPLPRERCSLEALGRALDDLRQLGLMQRRTLFEACVLCITADRAVTAGEAEMIRVVAAALDLPMPPIMPGETPG
ncbi:MAG: M48 family metallopeptidase [Candidatus Sumerlaeia bacterium]|nr:M48 family metallopeptidase [Candidatus Sumerlaeia bacterium]